MTSDYSPHHPHNHHVPRLYVFLIGAAVGILAGLAICLAWSIRDTETWTAGHLSVVAAVHAGDVHTYYLHNSGGDYSIPEKPLVFDQDAHGLVAAGSKIDPAFIPAGSTVAVTVHGKAEAYTIFDPQTHLRIELRGSK